MSTVPAPQPQGDRPLTLAQVVADLIADNLVPREEAEKLVANRRFSRTDVHPLVIVADQKWKDPRSARKLLTVESLTQWLAEKCALPYLHIDPFKIDFTAVTKVMSNAYAQRYRILPVSVNTREATIATSEPWVRGWEASLKQVLRLDVKRVIANPVDIQGYIVEFYNLARSVQGASDKDKEKGGAASSIANFEQLVQLGRSGQLDANDQHVVHICDWLFNYAFEQRARNCGCRPCPPLSARNW
jgi:general secretion pathway protein E